VLKSGELNIQMAPDADIVLEELKPQELLEQIGDCFIDVPQGEKWKEFFQLVGKFRAAVGKDLMPYIEELKEAIIRSHDDEIVLIQAHKNYLRHLGYHQPPLLRDADRITCLQLYHIFSAVVQDRLDLKDYRLAKARDALESQENSHEAAEEILKKIEGCVITRESRGRKNFSTMLQFIYLYKSVADVLEIPEEQIIQALAESVVKAHVEDTRGVRYHKELLSKMIRERKRFQYDEVKGEIVPKVNNKNLNSDVQILEFTDDVFYRAELLAKAVKRQHVDQLTEI